MATPRRRNHDDDLPELPPLDDDGHAAADDPRDDVDVADDESAASLDDAPLGDDDDEALDEPEAVGDDEAVGPDGDAGDDDEVDARDERWVGEDPNPRGEPDDVDDLAALPPDDRGAEGPEGESDDALEALPPLDDGADDEEAHDESVLASDLPAFALPRRAGVTVRALYRADARGAARALVGAPGVAVGAEQLWVASDALVAFALGRGGDVDADGVAVEPPADEVPALVVVSPTRTLTVATLAGAVWRRARGWRRVGRLDDGRAVLPAALVHDGERAWALGADGALRREDDGHLRPSLPAERVRAVAADDRGGVVAVVAGRRRDALRRCDDGMVWRPLALPEAAEPTAVARAGEVFAAAAEAGGWVSVDGGATWRAWPALAGATALCLTATDDGDARLAFAVHDAGSGRVAVASARVGAAGEADDAWLVAELTQPHADDDDDGDARVARMVSCDRAGRRIALATAAGAVWVVGLSG